MNGSITVRYRGVALEVLRNWTYYLGAMYLYALQIECKLLKKCIVMNLGWSMVICVLFGIRDNKNF